MSFLLCQTVELKAIENVAKDAAAACSSMSGSTMEKTLQGQVYPAHVILILNLMHQTKKHAIC